MDRHSEAELPESEVRQRLSLIEQLTEIGYWEVDLTDRTLRWSKATYRIFGVDPEVFQPSLDEFDRLIHPDDLEKVHAAIHGSRETGVPYQIEHRIVLPDATVRHVLEHGSHEFAENGRPVRFRGTVQNISAVNDIRERLVRAEREASLSRVLVEVAHDFNNLLSVVSGNLDILKIRYGSVPDASRLIERAHLSVEDGAALAERLLAFFNRQLRSPIDIDLVSTIREFLPTLSRVVGTQVEIEFRSELDQAVGRLDKVRLETAVLNAALNARDAMPDGGRIVLSLSDVGRAGHSNPMMRLAISDTGTGIHSEILGRVFDPFVTTKSTRGGTGLGLAIIRDFAEDSGGSVSIQSEQGVGTVLNLFLPRRETGASTDRQSVPPSIPYGTGQAILLVEDNDKVRSSLAEGLSHLGLKVTAFPSPTEALEHLQGTTVDVSAILSDVRLPGPMDGFEFVKMARKTRPNLPALFISGYVGSEINDLSFTGGDTRIIRKPFRIADLLSALNELTRQGPVGTKEDHSIR